MEVKFKKLKDDAKIPFKKYDNDAGFDLTAIWKNDFDTNKYIEYGTGLAFDIPKGYVGLLFPRSSITNTDLILKNSVGVVDSGYLGEIKFRFYNLEGDFTYEVGDRVGQIVFVKIPDVQMIESNELSDTNRGTAGYGSSGK